eukprot:TRINITY_DN5933_c0_g2_i2.p1 TRINITY_DN5933_c0_g2~~TRINITY_DN5933_c0_g2_i2.p1  ORF type:complete len:849 (-),score=199.00 TRINITY_DN5933_c0_g2_i2:55-2535(-)
MGICCGKSTVDKGAETTITKVESTKTTGTLRSQYILSNRGNITDIYMIDTKWHGPGYRRGVAIGMHRDTKVERAIKTMSKGNIKHVQRFKQEVAIMKSMDHPNVLKLFETFEDRKHIFLVMELCSGGELFDRIVEAGYFSEKDAAIVMHQLLSAVCYMHSNCVCHRDLKPETFLFLSKGPIDESVLKITDFASSTRFSKENPRMSTRMGSAYYIAPQVLGGSYDQSCDLWSCGAIMYTMLCGYPPFRGKTEQEVLRRVRKGRFSFDPKDWKLISEDAKTLIASLLKLEPQKRCTADQALQMPWVRDCAPLASKMPSCEDLIPNLRRFNSTNKLKRAALNIIAGQVSETHISGLLRQFKALDKNGDGMLSSQELRDAVANANLGEVSLDLDGIIQGVDSDGSGLIDYTEFLAATLDEKFYSQHNVCLAAFAVFDQDGDGQITLGELKAMLEAGNVDEVLDGRSTEELLKEVDLNGDGTIDFEEFMNLMRGGRSMSLEVDDVQEHKDDAASEEEDDDTDVPLSSITSRRTSRAATSAASEANLVATRRRTWAFMSATNWRSSAPEDIDSALVSQLSEDELEANSRSASLTENAMKAANKSRSSSISLMENAMESSSIKKRSTSSIAVKSTTSTVSKGSGGAVQKTGSDVPEAGSKAARHARTRSWVASLVGSERQSRAGDDPEDAGRDVADNDVDSRNAELKEARMKEKSASSLAAKSSGASLEMKPTISSRTTKSTNSKAAKHVTFLEAEEKACLNILPTQADEMAEPDEEPAGDGIASPEESPVKSAAKLTLADDESEILEWTDIPSPPPVPCAPELTSRAPSAAN